MQLQFAFLATAEHENERLSGWQFCRGNKTGRFSVTFARLVKPKGQRILQDRMGMRTFQHVMPRLTPRFGTASAACVVALAALFARHASSQDSAPPTAKSLEKAAPAPFAYTELRTVPVESKDTKKKWRDWLKSGDHGADGAAFNEYVTFRIEEFTRGENVNLKLSKKREEFLAEIAKSGQAPSQDLHNKLNAKLVEELPKIVGDQGFHPATRSNCALLLGGLNRQETAPVAPLPEAYPLLKKFCTDKGQPEYVRIAAFNGMQRHATAAAGIPANERANYVRDLIDLAKQAPAGDPKQRDGQIWLRGAAIDGLRIAADKWPEANNAEVAQTMAAIVADASVDLMTRSSAAEGLGVIDGQAIPKDQVAVWRDSLVQFLVAAAADSLVKKGIPPAEGGAASNVSATPAPPKPTTPPKSRLLASKRLMFALECGVQGLKGRTETRGLRAAADDAGKKQIDDVVAKANGLVADAKSTKISVGELAKKIQTFADEVGKGPSPIEVAPAAAAPAGVAAPAPAGK